jgi:hypothetical protein
LVDPEGGADAWVLLVGAWVASGAPLELADAAPEVAAGET